MKNGSPIETAREVIRVETEALKNLDSKLNESFTQTVELIYNSKGRVIVTGAGKSGIIGRKIVATLNSTGTAALYMHPSDAVHGDLGMVRSEDVVIVISKSGGTEEIVHLMPLFRRIGVKIIGLVGNPSSLLARESDIVLDVSVKEEACPHDLAPTSSTTATLVMGDALAIALLVKRNFTKEDFAAFHPGGMLGKKLLMRVEEIMARGANVPVVKEELPLPDAIMEMTHKRLGATCVVNSAGELTGIITDGDLRRLLQRRTDLTGVRAVDAMTRNPKAIKEDLLAVSALELMENYNITQLVVVDDARQPVGMVHLHDLVKQGFGGNSA